MYVFHHLRKVSPGTKILVLTGSSSEDFIGPLMEQKHDADIWSEGEKDHTVEFLKKIQIDQAPEKISEVVAAIRALSDVELQFNGLNLSMPEDRLVRICSPRNPRPQLPLPSRRADRAGANRNAARSDPSDPAGYGGTDQLPKGRCSIPTRCQTASAPIRGSPRSNAQGHRTMCRARTFSPLASSLGPEDGVPNPQGGSSSCLCSVSMKQWPPLVSPSRHGA